MPRKNPAQGSDNHNEKQPGYVSVPINERWEADPDHPGEFGLTNDGAIEIPAGSVTAQRILQKRQASLAGMRAILAAVAAPYLTATLQ